MDLIGKAVWFITSQSGAVLVRQLLIVLSVIASKAWLGAQQGSRQRFPGSRLHRLGHLHPVAQLIWLTT